MTAAGEAAAAGGTAAVQSRQDPRWVAAAAASRAEAHGLGYGWSIVAAASSAAASGSDGVAGH